MNLNFHIFQIISNIHTKFPVEIYHTQNSWDFATLSQTYNFFIAYFHNQSEVRF